MSQKLGAHKLAMEGNVQQKSTPLTRELTRIFSSYNKHSVLLKKNLKETNTFFREIRQNYSNACASAMSSESASLEAGQLSCIAFPSHEEEFLRNTVGAAPYILVLGQNCTARYQLLNCLLGERLLPLGPEAGEACGGVQGTACKRRKLCFTHGRQTRLSLALPGQYELVHQLAANRGRWDTVPREDLEIHEECEDPAHRLAELEITLHHPLLQEAKVMVVPCASVQPMEEALEDCTRNVIPIILYAIKEDSLNTEQVAELWKVKELLSFPICFIRLPDTMPAASPEPSRRTEKEKEREKSALHKQLLSLGFLSSLAGNCSCGAPTQMPTPGAKPQSMLGEAFDRLHRILVPFTRQVLQNQQVEAASLLNGLHCRCLDLFINQAFDMQRDLQITPRRLEYTREKEGELFTSLMAIANRKQEEMKEMIVETLGSMKEQLLEDAANLEFMDVIVTTNGEPVTSKEIKSCIHQIQELIVLRLNQAVANKLISSVDYLRESFVGTLERCLSSLEKSHIDSSVHNITSNHLKQLLNAAYHVEVTFHSGSSVTRLVWEQIKQIIHRITFVNPPAISHEWKRKVAQDAIESLSAAKLARSICSQFRTRLNSSHEAFAASLRQLEEGHTGRLERTEDLWLRVRKDHAPRLARLSLESRSLRDVLLHGKPKIGRELGRGQYGVVYLCDSWGGRYPCALKSVVPPDDKHWNDLALEFHYTRSLPKHERLVDLHGSVIDHTYGEGSSIAVLLIMERLHRDLYTGLKAGLSLRERLQIALDVVEGIRFLHSQGLLHRDIKLKNVLLDKQNRAKITDLGFCKPEAMMSGSIVGTPIHMAPELFTGKYDNSVDVYAFGILFWYLCTGSVKLPEAFEKCSSKDQLWNNVKKGARPERLSTFDEECWQLMEACWNGDPSQRPLLGIVEPGLQSIMVRLCSYDSEQKSSSLEDSN
ncbi:dual serine/threonine and tyrosine protein kinase [Corythoichthys intestinalis]|uniref:dual serine/threonine and tyrosine protein kinase n=1 Tax=Corythoichthys intestinalis TaxID=161448 RepID=UPI0025A513C4|nr:dual serine/threonine and tyrosine protein kinase [Corythoichthys intestinalis]XP_061814315.1 dual serine/threonine and tyrosine protein kinase [Nerophis lumbriciformis]